MAKSVEELEQIVMRLNRDLIAWQKWGNEFRNWVVNELNRVKAGRPNAPTPVQAVAAQPDERDIEMERMRKRMKYMARDLDIIAAESMFGN